MRLTRLVHRGWQGACLVSLALLIAVRALRYLLDAPPPALDHLLGSAMIFEAQLFLWTWVWARLLSLALAEVAPVLIPMVLAVGAAWLVLCRWLPKTIRLRRLLIRREGAAWHFQPLLHSIFCTGMLLLHFLFDANPFVSSMCGSSLLLLALLSDRRTGAALGGRTGWLALAWSVFFAAWLLSAHDAADRITVALWAALLLGAARLVPRFLGASELRWLLVLGIVPANLMPAVLPLVLPLHDGAPLGSGFAYSFCESPKAGRLFASVPNCSSVEIPGRSPSCLDGTIRVYDSETLEPLESHRFFSETFSGRLEQLVCFDDEVQVALQGTRLRGVDYGQTALAFPIDSPQEFQPNVAGRGMGSNIAHDARRDAVFYVGEFTHRLLRLDRRTDEMEEVEVDLARSWLVPVHWNSASGSFGMAIDASSDRLVLYEYHAGRGAHALDLATLEPVAHYALNNGGSWGVSFDPARGQILFPSTWGIEIVEAATGRVLARRRFGLGTRMVLFDASRNRLYLSSTIEGKLRVLDRDTLELLEQIPIGLGTRNPYLSLDGRRLFASSYRAYYYWPPSELGPPPEPRAPQPASMR